MPVIVHNVVPPTNTIALLETIGADASLRRASPEALLEALVRANATIGLKQAVSTGDRTHLSDDLGDVKPMDTPNHPNNNFIFAEDV